LWGNKLAVAVALRRVGFIVVRLLRLLLLRLLMLLPLLDVMCARDAYDRLPFIDSRIQEQLITKMFSSHPCKKRTIERESVCRRAKKEKKDG
jgi:hypothetical protein